MSTHLTNDAYRRMAAVLDEHGIPHEVVNATGRGHPRLVFFYRGEKCFHPISNSRLSTVNAVKIAEADIRRAIARIDAKHDAAPATSTSLTPFTFEGMDVRLTDRDGCPWFILADVCRVLEIGNNRDAASRLDADEKSSVDITDTRSKGGAVQRREMTIVNESGLYSLILTSRKPAAKRFKKWVTSEVLPSIRRTGSYSMVPTLESLPQEVRKEIGGIVKAVVRSELGDIRAGIDLLLDGVSTDGTPGPDGDLITSLQIAEMAGAVKGRRGRGLTSMICQKMKDYCIEHGYRMGKVDTHPGKRTVFSRTGAKAWLDVGGRDMILTKARAAEARRKGQLRLV